MRDIRARVLWWAVRRRVSIDKPFIIAVTGSVAKTSTKVAIGAVLRRVYPNQVRVGYGNLNSLLGVPLAILDFHVDFYKQHITWQWILILTSAIWRGLFGQLPRYLVLEYGADKPGDIGLLAERLRLDAAAITITGPAHLEYYTSVEQIAQEKGKILSAVKKGGWALVSKSDPHLEIYKHSKIELIEVDSETADIAVNFARAIGRRLRIDSSVVEEAVAALPRPEGRLQMKDLGSIKLLDDSYNANPLSMKAALGVLAKMPGRKIAVLGDMLELGPSAENYHREIGVLAHKTADVTIGVGLLSRAYQPNQLFANSTLAIEPLLSQIKEGDSILVKGSHGVHMEKIVEAINTRYQRRAI